MDDKNKNEEFAQKKIVDQILNPCIPYYLHTRENPELVIVSQNLNETIYSSWSRNLKHGLVSKNYIKFIYGNIKAPKKDEPLYNAWER